MDLTIVSPFITTQNNYLTAQKDIAALDEYYSSDLWKKDFADDEAGLLPDGLKRGVLSEDGIWNLLSDCKELNGRLRDAINESQSLKQP